MKGKLKRRGADSLESWVAAFWCSLVGLVLFGMVRLSGMLFVASMEEFHVGREQASFPYVLCDVTQSLISPVTGSQVARKYQIMYCSRRNRSEFHRHRHWYRHRVLGSGFRNRLRLLLPGAPHRHHPALREAPSHGHRRHVRRLLPGHLRPARRPGVPRPLLRPERHVLVAGGHHPALRPGSHAGEGEQRRRRVHRHGPQPRPDEPAARHRALQGQEDLGGPGATQEPRQVRKSGQHDAHRRRSPHRQLVVRLHRKRRLQCVRQHPVPTARLLRGRLPRHQLRQAEEQDPPRLGEGGLQDPPPILPPAHLRLQGVPRARIPACSPLHGGVHLLLHRLHDHRHRLRAGHGASLLRRQVRHPGLLGGQQRRPHELRLGDGRRVREPHQLLRAGVPVEEPHPGRHALVQGVRRLPLRRHAAGAERGLHRQPAASHHSRPLRGAGARRRHLVQLPPLRPATSLHSLAHKLLPRRHGVVRLPVLRHERRFAPLQPPALPGSPPRQVQVRQRRGHPQEQRRAHSAHLGRDGPYATPLPRDVEKSWIVCL